MPITSKGEELQFMQMIEIHNLKKKIGSKEILKGVDLAVKKGEVMAIIGPSGGGKSTLLRCINRLTEFDGGDVIVDGVSVKRYDPLALRRTVGLVFQLPVMFEGSVERNIAYGPIVSNQEYRKEDVESIAREIGLEKFLLKDATKLSVGEQQRVALARVLILKPKVLLLDEPTSALDPKNEEKIESLILKLVRSRKITVLWVTHDVSQAKRVGDRIAVMKDGKIVATGEPNKIEWGEVYA